jgi:Yip1 domain
MNLHALFRLPVSVDDGWPDLIRIRPSLLATFAFLVLPLSLVPPLMLYWAGTYQPEMFPPDLRDRPWAEVATVFFVAELVTLAVMGWLIRRVALGYGLDVDYHDTYLLASITPIPMWLSALGLLVPTLLFAAILAAAGLVTSCAILYHGIQAYCRTREDVAVAGLVRTVLGLGFAAWCALLAIALA